MTEQAAQTAENLISSIRAYKQKGHVLDLGCGEGGYAIFLAKQGFKVTAVDHDADKLEKLETNARHEHVFHRLTIKQDDIRAEINGEWDVVIMSLVLHHLPWMEGVNALARAQELTRPGGLHACVFWTDEGDLPRLLSGMGRAKRGFFPTTQSIRLLYEKWDTLLKGHRPAKTPLQPGREKLLSGVLCTGLFRKRP